MKQRSLPLIMALNLITLGVSAQEVEPADTETSQKLLRTINIAGYAERQVEPDQALFYVGAEFKDKDSEVAMQKLSEINNSILEILKNAGVQDQDIQTQGPTLDLIYDQSKGIFSKPEEYRAWSQSNITVKDLQILPKLLGDLGQSGANHIGGLNFEISNQDQIIDELTIEAVSDARNMASQMAQTAGASLGKPIKISTGDVNFPEPLSRSDLDSGKYLELYAAESAPNQTHAVSPGLQTISSRVNVQFELK